MKQCKVAKVKRVERRGEEGRLRGGEKGLRVMVVRPT